MTTSGNTNRAIDDFGRFDAEYRNAAPGEVRPGRHDRMLYSTDASLYQVEPLGVVIPRNLDDLREAVRRGAAARLPILPRGAGVSLAGQTVNRAVVLDCSPNLRAIHPVDVSASSVRVEPGVVLDELNEELLARGHNLFFAPDVATSRHATIGGMIGNNSAGARSVRYGMTADNVLAIDAIVIDGEGSTHELAFAEGAAERDPRLRAITERVIGVVDSVESEIRKRFPRIVRRADGYALDRVLAQLDEFRQRGVDPIGAMNLAPLLVGSEGTLAVTTGATLQLEPLPIARSLIVCAFASLDEAIAAVNPILTTNPTAVELLDDLLMQLAQENAVQRGNVALMPTIDGKPPAAVLYVEYSAFGGTGELDAGAGALRSIVDPSRCREFREPGALLRAWALRKAGEPLLHGLPGLRKPITFVEDTAVDPSRLPEFVRRFREIVERHGTSAAYFAHASVGCLHIRPLLNIHDARERKTLVRIAEDITDLVVEFGGALTGEHGDGRVRSPLLERYFGRPLMDAFREIKRIFDPLDLCNPGNIVGDAPAGSIAATLRIMPEREQVVAPDVKTHFDFSDQHGLTGAVEQCNGSGVCRKKRGATMCPSYMATLDERHSTRGRANALRLAITGQFGQSGDGVWSDAQTLRTLDWCLSCKACKAECPSNVDVARLKSEYLAQRNRARGGAPLKDRMIANVRTVNRLGSMAPALANLAARSDALRSIAGRFFGVDRRRSLPPAARPLDRLIAPIVRNTATRSRTVAIFGDCFTMYSEPGAGVASARLLDALGYRVELVSVGCCGRPGISVGALDIARRQIESTVRRLTPIAGDHSCEALLVCEPSCLSAMIDDWKSLTTGADRAAIDLIASKAVLPEQFIHDRWDTHPEPMAIPEQRGEAILHAHCHQKALLGDDSSANLLRRLLGGDRLRVLDSGCCGMAGSFGFDESRYDLSMAIGERVLLPAARLAGLSTAICAPGASCRHQILDGAGRHAIHPIELAAGVLLANNAPANSNRKAASP
ncbi:MAG: FAD-binding protein [Phycisphaeraceae bacterium]|nr:FAD-binding protein [Phycisphaeraceae bacterium]